MIYLLNLKINHLIKVFFSYRYNLSDNITTNIYTVNHAWRTLDHTVRLLGTDRDNPGLRDKV